MSDNNFIKRVLSNPALGLLPYLIFSILIGQINTFGALAIGFSLSIMPFVFRIPNELRVLYDVSAWSFLISAVAIFVLIPDFHSQSTFILAEINLVFSLMIFRLSRKSFMKKVVRNKRKDHKHHLYESFQIAFQVQYALTFHIIVILAFRVLFETRYPIVDAVLAINLFQLILVAIILLEASRLKVLNKHLKSEEWLPVVSESGNVQGKVAKSVSIILKNKFLHPLVRVALIYDGKLYLKNRDDSRLLDSGKLDYPFEKYMKYKHNLEEAIKNTVKNEIKTDDLPVRFLLKYVFENENTKRLIFLYVSNIASEKEFNDLQLQGGKLWTTNQIEDNIGKDVFSECFELEFEYLKNTVLMINMPHRKAE